MIFKIILLLFLSFLTYSKDINRIVSTIPSLTEMVAFLNKTESLVGVTPYCSYPKQVKNITKIGTALELNYEKLLKLKPDLVLLPKTQDTKALDDLSKLKINTMTIAHERLDEIVESLYSLDTMLESNKKLKIDNFKNIFKQRANKYKKVLIVISKEGNNKIESVRTAGVESIYDDLVKRLGYENALGSQYGMYPQLNIEQILKLEFDYILRIGMKVDEQEKNDWNKFLYFEKTRFIYEDYAVVTGPRLGLLYKDIEKILK